VLSWCGFLYAAAGGARAAHGAADAVGLIASPGSRLAEELGRELEASGFLVFRQAVGARQGPHAALADLAAGLLQGVFVAADDRSVIVFARRSSSEEIHTRIEMQVDPGDGLSRRRACLTVVEYLRVLANQEATSGGPPPGAGSPADSTPPPAPSPIAAPAARPTDPTFDAGRFEAVAPAQTVRPTVAAHLSPVAAAPPPTLGVATTLDLNTALGQPSGHLQFIWHFPIDRHLVLRLRALWPLLGEQVMGSGVRIRMWTFGAGGGLGYSPFRWSAPIRPYLGVTAGVRLALAEISEFSELDSRSSFTPSANLGLQAGLAYALSELIELFVEIEASRDWLAPAVQRSGFERAAADATSLHSSLGVLFEY
jgi:hypothetical protein